MTATDDLWEPPPPAPALAPEEVHVWRVLMPLPESRVATLRELLTPEERGRAERFLFPIHRARFTAARGFLRLVLGHYLNGDPAGVRFRYGVHGKPELEGAGDLRFNLSHSEDAALVAVTRGRELGIDVERVRTLPNFEQLAQRFFAPAESAALAEIPAPDRERAFFACWTRKEAYLKALGDGLTRPLEGFIVSLRPDEPARLLEVRDEPAEAARWSLRSLEPWPGYIACVAVRAHGGRLCCRDGSGLLLGP